MKQILAIIVLLCVVGVTAQNKKTVPESNVLTVEKTFDKLEEVLDRLDIEVARIKFNMAKNDFTIQISHITAEQKREIIKTINELPAELKKTKIVRSFKKMIKKAK